MPFGDYLSKCYVTLQLRAPNKVSYLYLQLQVGSYCILYSYWNAKGCLVVGQFARQVKQRWVACFRKEGMKVKRVARGVKIRRWREWRGSCGYLSYSASRHDFRNIQHIAELLCYYLMSRIHLRNMSHLPTRNIQLRVTISFISVCAKKRQMG